jgi:phosphatidylglycerophosphate synthase
MEHDLQPRWYWYETSVLTITVLIVLANVVAQSWITAALFLTLLVAFVWGYLVRKEGSFGDRARSLAQSRQGKWLAWILSATFLLLVYLLIFGFSLP